MARFGQQQFSPLIFLFPACCDLLATSTLFIALNLTSASNYLMFVGAAVIFTALLSVCFLGSSIRWYQWIGMFFVFCGMVIVSLGDFIKSTKTHDVNSVLTGNFLIIASQFLNAMQFTLEEKFVKASGYDVPPLQAVGWEGVFGLVIVGIALIPMYYIPWNPTLEPDFWQDHPRFEDVIDGFCQLAYIPTLTVAFVVSIVSIALYNFAGMSVTRELSATTRVLLDNIRIVFVWIFVLALKWQRFEWYQPIGFTLLIIGAFAFISDARKVIRENKMKRDPVNPAGVNDPNETNQLLPE